MFTESLILMVVQANPPADNKHRNRYIVHHFKLLLSTFCLEFLRKI